jgi:hypothetical protein
MNQGAIFEVAPATVKTGLLNAVLLISILVVLGVTLAIYWAVSSGRNARFEIRDRQLIIHGGMYGRTLYLSDLDLDHARPVDLTTDPVVALQSRRNGLALPGLQCGWFRLRNKEKALVFITDPTRAAYIPTRQGYALLFSLRDAKRFIDTLAEAH